MDTTQRIEDLIFLIDELSHVLEDENRAILNGDSDGMRDITEKKERLSLAYESRMKGFGEEIQKNPISADDLPADLIEKMSTRGAMLSERIVENATLLEAGIEANRRVVDLIADAVKTATPGPGTYAGNGQVPVGGHPASPTSAPLSLNQVL